jgi:hypothetical protein
MFLLRGRAFWEDYFPGTSPSYTFERRGFTTVQSTSSTYVFVSNCLFNGCTSTSNGGALSCTSSVQCLLVESTSFFSCSTSGQYGGAIYFYNTNSGECVLHKVCGNDCISTYTSASYGQFANINVRNTISNKNYFSYSSVSRCVGQSTNHRYTLHLYNGKIYCPSVNSSMNKCYYHTGILCASCSDSSYVTFTLIYSTITDNVATICTCVCQYRTAAKGEIKCCNILRNKQGSPTSEGTIRFDGHSTVKDSCILMNNATYTFYAWSSYIITVSNCTLDSYSTSGSVNIQSTATKSFIYALSHISTKNCVSEYDSAGILTADAPSMKKVHCYTCNCQVGISDLISLTYLFIVTFIHSDPSC